MPRFGRGIAAAVLAATLGWAGGVEAQGHIVIYSSNDATLNKLVASEFAKATGVQADVISAGSGVVIKRVQTEKDRPQGDIVWGISRSLLQTNALYFDSYASQHKMRCRLSSATRRIAGSAPTCTCSSCCRTPSRCRRRRGPRAGRI